MTVPPRDIFGQRGMLKRRVQYKEETNDYYLLSCHSTSVNGIALLDSTSACGLLSSNSVTDIKSKSFRFIKGISHCSE